MVVCKPHPMLRAFVVLCGLLVAHSSPGGGSGARQVIIGPSGNVEIAGSGRRLLRREASVPETTSQADDDSDTTDESVTSRGFEVASENHATLTQLDGGAKEATDSGEGIQTEAGSWWHRRRRRWWRRRRRVSWRRRRTIIKYVYVYPRRRRRRRRRNRRRGLLLQNCNIITGGGVTMACPPGFSYSAKGVCRGYRYSVTCREWGNGVCDPRHYVLPNGLAWPNKRWVAPKAVKSPTIRGSTFVKGAWWSTNGAPVDYCHTPDTTALIQITSCTASKQQRGYPCKAAMDGLRTGKLGWAYNGKKNSWANFEFGGKFEISRVDVLSGVGRKNHHFIDFKIKTGLNTRFVDVAGMNFVTVMPKRSKIIGSRAIIRGKMQRVDLSFDKRIASSIRIISLRTDASNNNGVLTEVLVYRHNGCKDIAHVGGHDRIGKWFWKSRCKKIPAKSAMVQVQMGLNLDSYKPQHGSSFCDMLTSNTKHQWSPDKGFTWKTPAFYSAHFGGSSENWPKLYVQGDNRHYLSFWGNNRRRDHLGGCCSDGIGPEKWGRSFTMKVCDLPVGASVQCARGLVHTMGIGGKKLGCIACKSGYYDDGAHEDSCTQCHGSARRRRATTCTRTLNTYKRVGPGRCLDASGHDYVVFMKAGCHTMETCQAGCENYDGDECHGFTFYTNAHDCGHCEIQMEAGSSTSSAGWNLAAITKADGVGAIAKSSAFTTDARVCFMRGKQPDEHPVPHKQPIPGWTCPVAITVKGFWKRKEYNGIYHLQKDLINGVPSYKKGLFIIASNKLRSSWKVGLPGKEYGGCDEDNFDMVLTDTSCFTDEGRCAFTEFDDPDGVGGSAGSMVGVSIISKSAQAACDYDGIFLVPIASHTCPSNAELPRCDAIIPGQMCEGSGECGTDDSLDNCGRFDVYYKQTPSDTTTTTVRPRYISAGWGNPECPYDYVRIMDFSTCLQGGQQIHPEAKDGILAPYGEGNWPSEPRGCYVKVYPDGVRRFVHLNKPQAGGVIHEFQTLICRDKKAPLIPPGTVTPCPGSINIAPPE